MPATEVRVGYTAAPPLLSEPAPAPVGRRTVIRQK
jgi:hypothetical protein